MALFTTFLTGPVLSRLYPRRTRATVTAAMAATLRAR